MTKWLGSLPVAVSEPGFSYMLTPWTRVMAPALARHANDELVARYLTPQFPHPYTMDHAFGYISYATTTTSEDILAIVRVYAATLEQEAIGSIGMIYSNDDDTAKFGYWLGQAHWGKGVASAAVHSFLTGVIINNDNDRRGVKLVEASVYAPNAASQRVLEKNGFQVLRVDPKLPYRGGGVMEAKILVKRLGDGLVKLP
ncbi:hypothetical protein DYB28_002546 [Aphanomyces astaci]|uniref:N-acetyltransferase domain-containing protein n=1 Tax=Aphanomyces astaci TaxID=112090 RepID=A0A9X8DZX2_APHAT|nr:hypothetical protein DYB28_002546 [Aphanomyces astaci]